MADDTRFRYLTAWADLHQALWVDPAHVEHPHLDRAELRYEEAVALLEQRDRQLEDWLNRLGGTRPYATRVIAASNSIATDATNADAVCDGVDDDDEIQTAINELTGNGGGVVLLLEGTFYVTTTITVPADVTLRGLGPATILLPGGASNTDWAVAGTGTARRIGATATGGV